MIPGRLRLRFTVAAGLLVLTTVTASVWTFFSLVASQRRRDGHRAAKRVRHRRHVPARRSTRTRRRCRASDPGRRRSWLGGPGHRTRCRGSSGDRTVHRVLGPDDERELATPLQAELRAYRLAADEVISVAAEREALVQYHQRANPVLRRAVTLTTAIRDRHFALARDTVARARDEAAAARRAVLVITLVALGIAVAVAWHLTRTVVGPVRRLTHGANAIRQGNFAERIDVASRDELGDLAAAFNEMAVDLAEFRRTNIGEVVRAKNTLEATLEALPDAVVLLDATGQIQSMNRAAVNVLGLVGVDRPQGLGDLKLDGLDLDAVADGGCDRRRHGAAGGPGSHDTDRTGRFNPATAPSRGAGAVVDARDRRSRPAPLRRDRPRATRRDAFRTDRRGFS